MAKINLVVWIIFRIFVGVGNGFDSQTFSGDKMKTLIFLAICAMLMTLVGCSSPTSGGDPNAKIWNNHIVNTCALDSVKFNDVTLGMSFDSAMNHIDYCAINYVEHGGNGNNVGSQLALGFKSPHQAMCVFIIADSNALDHNGNYYTVKTDTTLIYISPY